MCYYTSVFELVVEVVGHCGCACVKLLYVLSGSLSVILLVNPSLFDGFQCTNDVVPTKPTLELNTSSSSSMYKTHHLKVLSLRNVERGLLGCTSCLCCLNVFGK